MHVMVVSRRQTAFIRFPAVWRDYKSIIASIILLDMRLSSTVHDFGFWHDNLALFCAFLKSSALYHTFDFNHVKVTRFIFENQTWRSSVDINKCVSYNVMSSRSGKRDGGSTRRSSLVVTKLKSQTTILTVGVARKSGRKCRSVLEVSFYIHIDHLVFYTRIYREKSRISGKTK